MLELGPKVFDICLEGTDVSLKGTDVFLKGTDVFLKGTDVSLEAINVRSSLSILVVTRSVNSSVLRPRVVNVFAMGAVRGNLRIDERKVRIWERWIWEEWKRRV